MILYFPQYFDSFLNLFNELHFLIQLQKQIEIMAMGIGSEVLDDVKT